MSESTGLLLTIVLPAAVLITLIIATLLLICYTLRRKLNLPLTNLSSTKRVEEYASVQISPVDSKALILPPPIPSSPRPNEACGKRQEKSPYMPQEAAYAVLEDPTQKSNSNRYSLDLTISPSSATRGGHTNEQGPLYYTLENPQSSMILKNREKSHQMPVYELVASTGIPQVNLPPSVTAISGNVTCSTDKNMSGGPTILETTTPYSTK